MVGLEVVVRPLIFPDIRPRPRPVLPPQDDPTKGFAVIQGNPTVSTSNSFSLSISSSHSKPKEVERRVDEIRVYQQEDDGTVNRDNFVDLRVANKITMEEPGPGGEGGGDTAADEDGGSAEDGGAAKRETREYFYQRVSPKENIEVKRKDVIMRDGEEFKG